MSAAKNRSVELVSDERVRTVPGRSRPITLDSSTSAADDVVRDVPHANFNTDTESEKAAVAGNQVPAYLAGFRQNASVENCRLSEGVPPAYKPSGCRCLILIERTSLSDSLRQATAK